MQTYIKTLISILLMTIILPNQLLPKKAHAAGESISGIVFEDLDHSGTQNGLETGIAGGITVSLNGSDLSFIATTTTASDGSYSFDDTLVTSGQSYYVGIGSPSGWTNYDFTAGSPAMLVGPLGSGEALSVTAVGLYHNITVSGGAFYDADHDGIYDVSESAIPYIEATLYDLEGTPIAGPAALDSNGQYSFTTGSAGTYYVLFNQYPTNYTITLQNQGSDESIDNDVDPETARTTATSYTYGTEAPGTNFGAYIGNITIGDTVFNDANRNGLQDDSAGGIAGASVNLVDLSTTTTLASTTTDSSGNYTVSSALPGCIGPGYNWTTGSSVSNDCEIGDAGGAYYVTFTTSDNCAASSIVVTLLGADGSTLYSNTCGLSGSLFNNTSYTVGPFHESSTGTAHLNFSGTFPLGGIGNVFWQYEDMELQFGLPEGYTFTSQNIGGDESVDSDADSSGHVTIEGIGPAGTTTEIDVGAITITTANLTLSKTSSTPTPSTSSDFQYTLFLSNAGPDTATNITVHDALPAGLDFHSASSGSYNQTTGNWFISSLANGESTSVNIQVRATATGSIINTAEIMSADSIDPDSTYGDGIDQGDKKSASVTVSSGGGGGGGGGDGIHLHIFTDNNNNSTQDDGESNGASDTFVTISNGEESMDMEPDGAGDIDASIPAGTYSITIHIRDGTSITGCDNPITNITVLADTTNDLGSCGVYFGSGGGGGGGGGGGSMGTVHLHIFTDTNDNGTQDEDEADSSSGTTLTVDTGSETIDIDFDETGTIDTSIPVGSYTFILNIPDGATVTGCSNPITDVVITLGDTTDLGSCGVYLGSSGGSIGSSSGGSSHRFSRYSVPTSNLPSIPRTTIACLMMGKTSSTFNDTKDADVQFLNSITFNSDSSQHLIHGYGDGTFGPDHFLTRFELLKIALTSNCVGGGNFKNFTHPNLAFSDVPQDSSEESLIIGEAYNLGIISGVNNQFFPNKSVTFAEMFKILLHASIYFKQGVPLNPIAVTVPGITDPSFQQAIEYAKRLDILPFPNDQPFPQNNPVSRLEMAKSLARYIDMMKGTLFIN